jgi:hypothetical protein
MTDPVKRSSVRGGAVLVAAVLAALSIGCSQSRATPPPPVDDTTRPGAPSSAGQESHSGLSGREKLVILGGAAALYYLYKKHQAAPAQTGEQGQYYLSKNGRVYYRDSDHRPHWVTPPPGGIPVPQAEAASFQDYQGYDNRPTGRDLSGLGSDATN